MAFATGTSQLGACRGAYMGPLPEACLKLGSFRSWFSCASEMGEDACGLWQLCDQKDE